MTFDPRFLIFEFIHNIVLWEGQVRTRHRKPEMRSKPLNSGEIGNPVPNKYFE